MKFNTIIVFLISVVVARHNHRTFLESILKSKINLYTKVDNDVQNVMNNLFDSLNLAADFITKARIKLLLTMHYDLKNAAEKNYEVYDKIIAAAEPEMTANNKSSNAIELLELIEEILDDTTNRSAAFRAHKILRKHTKHKTSTAADVTAPTETSNGLQNLSEPVFADSREFMQFIQDFVKKVDNISEKDFIKFPKQLPNDADIIDDPNLDIWQPPPVLELDFVNDSYSRRIFRGKRTRIKSYPFLVSVHLMDTFTCAGSILTRDLVISAASCLQLLYNNRFYRENPRAVSVRVGSDYFARGGEKINIIEMYFHPSYDPKTLNNNLVLLRLRKHIRFYRREKKVKRISFDRKNANLAANTDGIIVVGWGARKKSNIINQFERMLVAQLDIYQVNECADIYSNTFVTDKHFCAGFITSGGGACNKDIGGPGIVGGILVGVISFGAPVCGSIDAPTVFTKLGYYAPWIDSIIQMYGLVVGAPTTHKLQTHQRYPYTSPADMRIDPIFSTTAIIRRPTTLLYDSAIPGSMFSFTKGTKALIAPVTPNAQNPGCKPPFCGDEHASQAELLELARADSAYHKDLLYGEVTENDFIKMFKTTPAPFDPMQHPLVNKSYFAIPDIHTLKSTSKYVTVPLTTSSTLLPIPPQLTDPVGPTTTPPSRTPPTTTEGHIADIETGLPDETFEHVDISDNEPEDPSYMQRVGYASYQDTTMAEPTTKLAHRHQRHDHSEKRKVDGHGYKNDNYLYVQ